MRTVLFLASNPRNTPHLRLDEEIREIDEVLRRSRHREDFTLEQKWAVRSVDIHRAMLDFDPQIVHFSGHGVGNEGIQLEDDTGQAQPVSGEALADLFNLFPNVECVLLNACYSEVQASAIAGCVKYVIGMKQEIGDEAAVNFAIGFYDALGAGKSVHFAYRLGCNAIRLAGILEYLTPVIKVNETQNLSGNRREDLSSPASTFSKTQLIQEKILETQLKPYVAHTYTLSQMYGFVGRQQELDKITKWATGSDQSSILCIVAIGGMGKSALAWHWFREIAPKELTILRGSLWWSFYESDSSFDSFITHGLAYAIQESHKEIMQLSRGEKEQKFLQILDKEPFLIILDGLERILLAYGGPEAAYIRDNHPSLDNESHHLAKTMDPHTGSFLKRLATVRSSRILITSRLYPADLQDRYTGDKMLGSEITLTGLSDENAISLWHKLGLTGERQNLLRFFHSFGSHPLVLKAFAGTLKNYRLAPCNFERWRQEYPDFNPLHISGVQAVMAHVLSFALRSLSEDVRSLLYTISAFRMSISYETLHALSVGMDKVHENEQTFHQALSELEERGLLGWDRSSNTYNLHPIVRTIAWTNLNEEVKQGIYKELYEHFSSIPPTKNYFEMDSLDELKPAIELYNALIGLKLFGDAVEILKSRIYKAMLYRFSRTRELATLFEMLFPHGLETSPPLKSSDAQEFVYRFLAHTYHRCGNLHHAIEFYSFHQNMEIAPHHRADSLDKYSDALRVAGQIRSSEIAALRSIELNRQFGYYDSSEGIALWRLGLVYAMRGITDASKIALLRAVKLFDDLSTPHLLGGAYFFLAQRELWFGNYELALSAANNAWDLAHIRGYERDFPRASRAQGEALLGLGNLSSAEERLTHALERARSSDFVEEELPALIALAELSLICEDLEKARYFLDDVWELAERGPYPTFHSDAFNVLAQVEMNMGNISKAISCAKSAYTLAWCDGPPYSYYWGVKKAKQHLATLEQPEPDIFLFRSIYHEESPEIIVNLDDQFHVDLERDLQI